MQNFTLVGQSARFFYFLRPNLKTCFSEVPLRDFMVPPILGKFAIVFVSGFFHNFAELLSLVKWSKTFKITVFNTGDATFDHAFQHYGRRYGIYMRRWREQKFCTFLNAMAVEL